jgi:hypothetical protein
VLSTNHEFSELSVDFVVQVDEVGVAVGLGLEGVLELHLGQLEEVLLDGVVDDGPGDLLVGLHGLVDRLLGVLEEPHDALHHAEGLVEGAVEVVGGEGILLQEVLSNHFGNLYT